MRHRVVQVDLRGRPAGEAADTVRRLLADEANTDLTLLLVIDEAAALKAHQQAYETLLSSHFTEKMLSVAVGRGDTDPPRIEVPGAVAQAAGVLWVPDPGGINWRLSRAAAATRRDRSEGPEAGLAHLLEILSLTDVFEEVLALVEKLPGRIANPGLVLGGADGGGTDFQQTLLAAGERVLDPRGGRTPEFTRSGRTSPPTAARLRKGGVLDNAADQARGALAEAQDLAGELTEGAALFAVPPPVAEATAAAGESVGRLRDRLEELFSRAHGNTELGDAQQDAIERAGVVLPDLEDFDPAKTRKAIEGYLAEALGEGVPLPRLAEGLDRQKDRLMPHGSRERIPALARACPDELLAGLREPRPMPGPEPWLPVVGLVAAALAGLSPLGPLSGLVLALLWTLLVAYTVLRGPGGRPGRHGRALVANGLAAVAGGVGAGLVVPATPPAVWALGIVVALGLTGWATLSSWRSRTRLWVAESGLDEAGTAVDELFAVLAAAVREWSEAGARLATADAVARMGSALDQVAAGIGDRTARLRREFSGTARSDPRIQHYLADLVRAAMVPRLRGLAVGSTAEHGEEARRAANELFAVWDAHVAEHGALGPPPFAAEGAVEGPAAPLDELSDLAETAAHDPGDVMWQLCSADDLPMLDVGSNHLGVVRFAPQHSRMTAEELLPPDTVWVPSARHAGVLRMVPIRHGLIVQSW
jgi:hypothetical protein